MLMLPSEKQAENSMVESPLNLSDLSIGLPVIFSATRSFGASSLGTSITQNPINR
jgi:hypothetical protein